MQELDYAKVGARIRQNRKTKGWSQDELAKRCGISMNFLGHIERGTKKMSLDTFVSLCRELEANADVLLFGASKADDNDSMYIQIMKSVADIMGSRDQQSS
ncbi:MAG: helix-turn-helix domain-containing protein [Eubacterium sp.]|nr:helix-turn-helix domain-containing protein [Eubacterium sp.]